MGVTDGDTDAVTDGDAEADADALGEAEAVGCVLTEDEAMSWSPSEHPARLTARATSPTNRPP